MSNPQDNATPSTMPVVTAFSKKEDSKPDPMFYHLYACTNSACVEDANPVKYSVHMRGIHSKSAVPINGVKCPGCSNEMKPAEHGATSEQVKAENFHSKYVIYPAPGQQEDAL